MRTLIRSVFFRSTSFAVVLLAAFPGEPTLAQVQQAAKTIVSGKVLDLNGQPIAGVLIGYKTPEELRAEREKRVRSAPPGQGVYGRMSEEQKREAIEEQSRIRPSTQGIFYSGVTLSVRQTTRARSASKCPAAGNISS